MQILVVDDSRAMRMIVKRNVSQIEPDVEFVEAENGTRTRSSSSPPTPSPRHSCCVTGTCPR